MSSHLGEIIEVAPERIESLRLILEKEELRSVTYDEALEIGKALVRLYKTLAEISLANSNDDYMELSI